MKTFQASGCYSCYFGEGNQTPSAGQSNLLAPHRAKTLHFTPSGLHPIHLPGASKQLFTNTPLHSAFSSQPLALPSGVFSRRKGGCSHQHHRNIPPGEPRSPSALVATTQPSPLLLPAITPRMRGPTSPQEGTGHPAVVPPAPRGHEDACSHPYLLPPSLCGALGRGSRSTKHLHLLWPAAPNRAWDSVLAAQGPHAHCYAPSQHLLP